MLCVGGLRQVTEISACEYNFLGMCDTPANARFSEELFPTYKHSKSTTLTPVRIDIY